MKKIVVVLIMLLAFTGCMEKWETVKTERVDAVIVDKDYTASTTWIQMMSTGKSTIPIVHRRPAKHEVLIAVPSHNGRSQWFDNESLYSAYDVYDTVKVTAVHKKSSNGSIRIRYYY